MAGGLQSLTGAFSSSVFALMWCSVLRLVCCCAPLAQRGPDATAFPANHLPCPQASGPSSSTTAATTAWSLPLTRRTASSSFGGATIALGLPCSGWPSDLAPYPSHQSASRAHAGAVQSLDLTRLFSRSRPAGRTSAATFSSPPPLTRRWTTPLTSSRAAASSSPAVRGPTGAARNPRPFSPLARPAARARETHSETTTASPYARKPC